MKTIRATLSEAEVDIILKLASAEVTRQLHHKVSDPNLVGVMMKARNAKEALAKAEGRK